MREIKFRAWDKDEKEMIGDVSIIHDTWDMLNEFLDYTRFSLKYMQYTGIKDDNGKEVYEGDIVSVKSTSEWHSYIDELYLIEFKEQDLGHSSYQQTIGWNAAVITKDNKRSSFSKGILSILHYHDGINTEIIGNIYENPELLEAD